MIFSDQQKEHLTKDKFKELKKELENLKTKKRKEVADQLEYAKSLGDLSENAEYHEAREMQAQIEDRIAKLETIVQNAQIISDKHTEKITVGSTATISQKNSKESFVYRIVGPEEIDADNGKISFKSPLGGALLGKKKGESVLVKTPRGDAEYVILKVE